MDTVGNPSPTITIAFNIKPRTEEAEKLNRCSNSSINTRLRGRKFNIGQLIEGQWFYNVEEIHEVGTNYLMKPRSERRQNSFKASASLGFRAEDQKACEVTIKLELCRENFERIKLALGTSKKKPMQYMLGIFDSVDKRNMEKLSGFA